MTTTSTETASWHLTTVLTLAAYFMPIKWTIFCYYNDCFFSEHVKNVQISLPVPLYVSASQHVFCDIFIIYHSSLSYKCCKIL
jgi:hypothetical protein